MSQSWAQQTERGTAFALRLIGWIALRLGRTAARFWLYPIVLYFLLLAPKPRRASYDYLRRVLPHPPRWWHVARHIHCFAATVLDRVYFLRGEYRRFALEVHGAELLQEKIDSGRGCLLLGSHLGSFEVLRAFAIGQRRLRLKVLMYEAHNGIITRMLHALNPEVGESVIPLGDTHALLAVHEFLQQGYLIGLLGDRVDNERKTAPCEFLGGPAAFPTGPMLLAGALHVPVILFYGIYRGGNRYSIHFEPFAEQIAFTRAGREQAVLEWTRRYVDRLAHHTRAAPYNWFNFYDYWSNAHPPE